MVFRAGLRDPCTRDVARLSESVACVAALRESRACTKTHALPYLLVLSEDEKSDWFKMKKYANLC
jgi:hypothetical protein